MFILYLKEDDSEMAKDIRIKTDRGLVVGTDRFINKLKKSFNHSLKYLRRGRPKKDG